jgi:hypothetical protein
MLELELANTLIVLGMFILRVAVPLAVTMALGYWLEKRLRPPESENGNRPVILELLPHSPSSKIIQLHCWDLNHCETTRRVQCAAFRHPDLPCWLALQVEGHKIRQECFTCRLYRAQWIAA